MRGLSTITLGASALASALLICALQPATARPAFAGMQLASSALGDLTPYRTIASDTLAIVDQGDIPAARARVKDLEAAWDKAEAALKPKDKATWTTLDRMIDAALTDLRTAPPNPAACAASLKALIAQMEAIDNA